MSPLTALLIDWVITALWPLLAKAGTERFAPVIFAQAGLIVGLLVLAPAMTLKNRWKIILSPELRLPLFFMGFFGSAVTTFLFITALGYTTPANAAIMAQIEILYSALICRWVLGEHIGMSQIAGKVLVIAGTGLILLHDFGSPRWKGDLIILLTPWMFQVSHIFAKRLPADIDAVTIAGGRVFYGALSLLPLALWVFWHNPAINWDREGALLILAQGILMNSINLVLWYLAIRRMDLAKATTLMLSYPALTVLFSWSLGHETIGPSQIGGLVLTFAGAWWISTLIAKNRATEAAIGAPANG